MVICMSADPEEKFKGKISYCRGISIKKVKRNLSLLKDTQYENTPLINTKVGFESEFLICFYDTRTKKYRFTPASSIDFLNNNGTQRDKNLGTDGASDLGEYRSIPYGWDEFMSFLPEYHVLAQFSTLWAILKRRNRREFVINNPNKLRIPCGTHMHFDWPVVFCLSNSYTEFTEVFRKAIKATKNRQGDRHTFSSYGGYNNYRHQSYGIEVRGFETVMYQSPEWITITKWNVLECICAKLEGREPEIIEYPELESDSQIKTWRIKIKKNRRKERITFTKNLEIITTRNLFIERATVTPNGFRDAQKFLSMHGFHYTEDRLKEMNERVYIIRDNSMNVIGVFGYNFYRRHIKFFVFSRRKINYVKETISSFLSALNQKYHISEVYFSLPLPNYIVSQIVSLGGIIGDRKIIIPVGNTISFSVRLGGITVNLVK